MVVLARSASTDRRREREYAARADGKTLKRHRAGEHHEPDPARQAVNVKERVRRAWTTERRAWEGPRCRESARCEEGEDRARVRPGLLRACPPFEGSARRSAIPGRGVALRRSRGGRRRFVSDGRSQRTRKATMRAPSSTTERPLHASLRSATRPRRRRERRSWPRTRKGTFAPTRGWSRSGATPGRATTWRRSTHWRTMP